MGCRSLVKWIDGYEGLYSVSESGEIYGHFYGEPQKLNLAEQQNGYLTFSLNKDAVKKTGVVHRIVANAFIKNPLNKPVVNHKNGIKTDNTVYNLEWCTQSENTQHAYDNGLCAFSTKRRNDTRERSKQYSHMRSMFTADEASDVLEMMSVLNLSQAETARILGCNRDTVWRLANGYTTNFK